MQSAFYTTQSLNRGVTLHTLLGRFAHNQIGAFRSQSNWGVSFTIKLGRFVHNQIGAFRSHSNRVPLTYTPSVPPGLGSYS